jgi:hypothetical protein
MANAPLTFTGIIPMEPINPIFPIFYSSPAMHFRQLGYTSKHIRGLITLISQ